jgi:hypothetical protein
VHPPALASFLGVASPRFESARARWRAGRSRRNVARVATRSLREPTVRIAFEDGAVQRGNQRAPLSELTTGSHIHGFLRFEIGGLQVPSLGFFGPTDVCFGMWLRELERAAVALRDPHGRHVFDEGEQGQPAFLFERKGGRASLSLVASRYAASEAAPEWQRMEFLPRLFLHELERAKSAFVAELRAAAPDTADAWLSDYVSPS